MSGACIVGLRIFTSSFLLLFFLNIYSSRRPDGARMQLGLVSNTRTHLVPDMNDGSAGFGLAFLASLASCASETRDEIRVLVRLCD